MRWVGAAVLLFIVSSPARASAPEEDAKDFFARGRELRAKGDCASAAPLFAKAWQLYPGGLGSLRNLAECSEQLGRFASARRAWLDLARALLTNTEPKYAGWSDEARDAEARLAPKVARLTIVVHATGAPVRVLVDGEPLDPQLLDMALDRDPGTYVVRVEGGRVPIEKSVTLAAAESKTLTFALAPKAEKGDPIR